MKLLFKTVFVCSSVSLFISLVSCGAGVAPVDPDVSVALLTETGGPVVFVRSAVTYSFSILVKDVEANIAAATGNPCAPASMPCQHGGVCSAPNGVVQCNCTNTGHSGNNCETGPCGPNPCQNGGICNPTPATSPYYQCQCVNGYTGNICQTSQCGSHPCQNGGTNCIPTSSPPYYQCQCINGYTGTTCQLPGCFAYNTACQSSRSSHSSSASFPTNTFAQCQSYCASHQHNIFGIWGSSNCLCFDSSIIACSLTASSNCNLLCDGDSTKKCGGSAGSTIISLYDTGA